MEDENPTMIDLSETLFGPAVQPAQQPRERTDYASADDVRITVEEEDYKEEKPVEEAPRSRFGWIRRK